MIYFQLILVQFLIQKNKIENSSKCFFVKPISLLVKNLSQIDKIVKSNKNKIVIIGGGLHLMN